MTSTGTLLRIIGAAILLIVVQFASVAAQAHVAHSHAPDGYSLHEHGLHEPGAAAGVTHSIPLPETTTPAAPAQSSARTETVVQNAQGEVWSSNACMIGCCGTGMGCCGHAMATVSPNFPPKACSLRTGFARLVSIREVDPQGLRKPPRSPT